MEALEKLEDPLANQRNKGIVEQCTWTEKANSLDVNGLENEVSLKEGIHQVALCWYFSQFLQEVEAEVEVNPCQFCWCDRKYVIWVPKGKICKHIPWIDSITMQIG